MSVAEVEVQKEVLVVAFPQHVQKVEEDDCDFEIHHVN